MTSLSRFAVAALVVGACSSGAPPKGPERAAGPVGGVPDATVAPAPAVPVPPVAMRVAHPVVSPHGTRDDPYYWLRDDTRSNKDVLDYLAAENAYAAAMLGPANAIEDTIVRETRARIDETEATPSISLDGYAYYVRYAAGQQRPIYARRKTTAGAAEEILLDANTLAAGRDFFTIGDYAVSRDGSMLAWTDDSVGRNQFTLHVKTIATGELLSDTATGIAPSVEWANDNKTLFYVGKDTTTLREDRVMRHAIGGAHTLVYQEKDGAYYVDISRTKSRKFVLIELDATLQSETLTIDADKPASSPRVFIPRQADHLYELEHLGGRFVIRTNDHADNFRIVEVPAVHPERRASWKDLVPPRADALVEGFALYDRFLAIGVRVGGLARVQVYPKGRPAFFIEGTDPAFAMSIVDTPDGAATRLRYEYDSLTAPTSTFEHDVATGTRALIHQEPAPGYAQDRYTSEYVHATAPDGTKIPISLVYRNDGPNITKRDGTAPLLMLGYGAYGESLEPRFERTRVSLLDRGWVVAIAHVRGGEELGEAWYVGGRQLTKQNTFTDFIAATEFLVANKYAARDRVFAEGASAGGLLVAVIANMRPDLYRGLVAWVPFVDAVTTMLDPSIPLVTNEYDEWGDPSADKATYDYILAYSPYDNVRAQAYPAMYVRTGLYDSQVQYYEPAKWVAKLRATKTDDHLLVLETDMSAGHEGKSGRFDAVREQARAYAFMLHVLGGAGAGR
jgi:oligopeptidase B